MARKLNTHVTATNPDTGVSETFGPDDELPDWFEGQVSAEGVWDGDKNPVPGEAGDPGNSGTGAPVSDERPADKADVDQQADAARPVEGEGRGRRGGAR